MPRPNTIQQDRPEKGVVPRSPDNRAGAKEKTGEAAGTPRRVPGHISPACWHECHAFFRPPHLGGTTLRPPGPKLSRWSLLRRATSANVSQSGASLHNGALFHVPGPISEPASRSKPRRQSAVAMHGARRTTDAANPVEPGIPELDCDVQDTRWRCLSAADVFDAALHRAAGMTRCVIARKPSHWLRICLAAKPTGQPRDPRQVNLISAANCLAGHP